MQKATSAILHGDAVERLRELPDASVHCVVTDPPYGLEFMGKEWDKVQSHLSWAVEALRVLKPGGHLVAFGGTRTHHRLWCALEDAGFEIRDTLMWLFGSGFPKSLNLDGEWDGWGTALKPAWEPIVLARKPLIGTVAANVQAHGTGALNVDGCRIGFRGDADEAESKGKNRHADFDSGPRENRVFGADARDRGTDGNYDPPGRWPANLVLDEESAQLLDAQSGERRSAGKYTESRNRPPTLKTFLDQSMGESGRENDYAGETGGASRFFFISKWEGREMLLNSAKAIMDAWMRDLANIADEDSCLPSEHAVSVLSDAVTLASLGEIRLSDCQGLSMRVTLNVLRQLCENVIVLIPSIERKSLPASFPISTGPLSPSPAKSAAPSGPTDTTTTTPGPTKSGGSAVVVTLATTPSNTAPGVAGSPLRFRYCAKASREERGNGNAHPTVKPVALMRWLVRLVTPPNGIILDPFLGSGTTAVAAILEGFECIGIDNNEEYLQTARERIERAELEREHGSDGADAVEAGQVPLEAAR